MNDQANVNQTSNLELDSLRRRMAILEQREADFRFLAENMGDVVFIVDMELRTTYVSPSIERILGYTPAERITQKVDEQLTPQSQKLVFEVLAEELALEKTAGADKNRSRTLELEYYHKDGSIKCLETYIRGARDSEGTLTGFYSLSRDITERKQAEEALRKSEKRFRAISDYAYNWENWLGTDGKLIWVNNAVLPFTGYSIDECFAMTDFPLPLVDEGDHEKFRQYFSLALQGSRYENIEFRIRCKDGSVKWAMLSWQPIYDSDGVSMGHRSSVRDITDRKRAEEALIASEEQYRSFSKMMRLMCDNVPDMIWAKDLERRFIFTNRAVCRGLLNAADTDEPVGKTDMFFVKRERESHPDNPQWHTFGEICIDSDKVVTESRKQAQFDEFGNVNGEFLFLDVQKAPFLDENGEMIGTVGCGRDVTAARESADKYRLLAEKMHDVVWIMDLELRWTYVSPSIELLLGFTPEERMSQKLLEHITPDSLTILRETFTREMEYEQQGQADPERVITLEMEQYHKNGSTRWVETLISGIRNDQGVLTGLHGLSRDITERKQAEEAIQKSEALLRAVFDSVQDFIFIKDTNRLYIMINSFFKKRFHVDPSVFLGHTDAEIPIFENKDKTGAIIQNTDALVLQGETAHYELTHRVCGTLITFDIMKTPIRDGQGNITGICGLSRDITERKQTEYMLRRSEEKFRFLTEHMNDNIFTMDMNLQTTYVSKSVEKILGFTPEERMKQDVSEQVTPNSLAVIGEILSAELEREQKGLADPDRSIKFEVEFYHKDGSTRWVENVISGIRDDQRVLVGIHGVSRDISERKESEEKLTVTLESLRKAFGTIVQVMVSAVESRDPYTAGHQNRSADLARAIATEMGLSQDKIDGISMAGSIHDIGKLSVPAEILAKPTKLSEIELPLVKQHALKGYEMLKDVESPWPLAEMVYQHHERMDGSGYPRCLKGDEILMEARILAVADVVESMASHRPYRPALGIDAALAEIENNKGTLYDSDVGDACLRLFREKSFQFEKP